MKPISVRLVALGEPLPNLDVSSVEHLRSAVIRVLPNVETFPLYRHPDNGWAYSLCLLEELVPKRQDEDVLICITSVEIEDNYILKRLQNRRVVVTIREVDWILTNFNIPIHNLILRMVYSVALISKTTRPCLLDTNDDWTEYAHVETRGCIFDMTPEKVDIVRSSDQPIICSECRSRLERLGLSRELIAVAGREVQSRIRKSRYWRMTDFISRKPLLSLAIASASALVLGVVASVIASFAYAWIT